MRSCARRIERGRASDSAAAKRGNEAQVFFRRRQIAGGEFPNAASRRTDSIVNWHRFGPAIHAVVRIVI